IPPGSKVHVMLRLARLWPDYKADLQVAPLDPKFDMPSNLIFNNNRPIRIATDKAEAKAIIDVQPGVPPGTYNLVLLGTGQVPFTKDPKAKQKPAIAIEQPSTPLTLTVWPRDKKTVQEKE